MLRLVSVVMLSFLLVSSAEAQSDSSSTLHTGAKVRVKVPRISPDWILGVVVTMQRTATCLAVRLEHTDAAGRTQYAFFTSVKALEVDRRTNQGVLAIGLPEATAGDWEIWPTARIADVAKRCQR